MKVRTQWGARNARLTYRAEGDSLEKVNVRLLARDEVGRFFWEVKYALKLDATQAVTSIVLSPSSHIEMPVWPQYKSQSQPCQDAWNSMWRALHKHEVGHARIFETELSSIASDLENHSTLRGSEGDNYMRRRLAAIEKHQQQFDTQTDHGRSRGVTLMITQACRSKP
jgi:predicted secreted Zn-dependent protease